MVLTTARAEPGDRNRGYPRPPQSRPLTDDQRIENLTVDSTSAGGRVAGGSRNGSPAGTGSWHLDEALALAGREGQSFPARCRRPRRRRLGQAEPNCRLIVTPGPPGNRGRSARATWPAAWRPPRGCPDTSSPIRGRVDWAGESRQSSAISEFLPAEGPPPRPPSDPPGDSIEPRADGVADPDRPGLLHQHQERSLEGVLGLVRVLDHAAAEPQYHRPMPGDQHAECLLSRRAGLVQEAVEQLSVGQSAQGADVEQCIERPPIGLHQPSPWQRPASRYVAANHIMPAFAQPLTPFRSEPRRTAGAGFSATGPAIAGGLLLQQVWAMEEKTRRTAARRPVRADGLEPGPIIMTRRKGGHSGMALR